MLDSFAALHIFAVRLIDILRKSIYLVFRSFRSELQASEISVLRYPKLKRQAKLKDITTIQQPLLIPAL